MRLSAQDRMRLVEGLNSMDRDGSVCEGECDYWGEVEKRCQHFGIDVHGPRPEGCPLTEGKEAA